MSHVFSIYRHRDKDEIGNWSTYTQNQIETEKVYC